MSLSDHSAPGSNAGFSFQFERALQYLATATAGSLVGVETDDDVAVRRADGTRLLEQDKHSIRENAKPFGDRSKDLWNTLKIWVEAIDSGEVLPEKTLFLMVTNKELPQCIAHKIGAAKSQKEVDACITELETAAISPPEGIQTIVARVLRSESRTNLQKLIKRCRVADSTAETAGDELRVKTISHLQLPEWCACHANSIFDELLGWMHRTALTSWQQNEPAWIKRDHFVNQIHAIIDLRKRRIIRERAEHLILVSDDKVGEVKGSNFVKQIHLISDDDSVADTAIREFICCNIEKARLSTEGNITDDDWLTFESTLLTRWSKIRARILRMRNNEAERDVGFEVFTDTTEAHCEKLAGSDTEQIYLTSGSYHRLAEHLQVGWHPRFEELMRQPSE
ncbi:MAG: hypothetical protein KA152_00155 [Verrucomicrobiales bacterium]|jgi:hypothetical protein|nr:hypothetical protein [Verrucomicrobiales bacterium]